jgi:hypothetical protein
MKPLQQLEPLALRGPVLIPSSDSPENPGNPLIPKPGWNPKFSSFVVRRRRVSN